MTTDTAQAFLHALAEDTGLQAKITQAVENAAEDDVADAVLAAVTEAGYPITADDLARITQAMTESDELSDEALDAVAGGGFFQEFGKAWKAAAKAPYQTAKQVAHDLYGI